MCSVANRRWLTILALAALMTLSAPRLVASAAESPAAEPVTTILTGDDDSDIGDVRRDAVRTVATVSMILILIMIVFVVILMIANRRLRVQYLGWRRKIRFKKLWDVWWSKEPPKE